MPIFKAIPLRISDRDVCANSRLSHLTRHAFVMCLLVASRSWRGVHILSTKMNKAEAQKGFQMWIQQLLITTVILLVACAPYFRDEPATVESFYLSVSGGGGITGLVTGCDFNSAGRTREWRWTLGAIDSLGSHMLPVTSIRERLAELTTLPSPDRPGNLTYRVVLTQPDETRMWTWSTNQPLTEWYRVTRKLCSDAAQDAENTTER